MIAELQYSRRRAGNELKSARSPFSLALLNADAFGNRQQTLIVGELRRQTNARAAARAAALHFATVDVAIASRRALSGDKVCRRRRTLLKTAAKLSASAIRSHSPPACVDSSSRASRTNLRTRARSMHSEASRSVQLAAAICATLTHPANIGRASLLVVDAFAARQ